MTELEQQLTNALTALSKQYEAEMEQQAEWVGELQEQVQRLEESVKDLKPQLGRTARLAFEGAVRFQWGLLATSHDPGCHGDYGSGSASSGWVEGRGSVD